MIVDAVVLAGAENTGKLREISDCTNEALIPVDGRPMVQYVIDALNAAAHVGKIVVVGPDEVRAVLEDSGAVVVPSTGLITENVKRGLEELDSERLALLVTSDIPLVTPEAIDDFIDRCSELSGDLFYPIVSKEVNDNLYPGTSRTYFRLREGTFTGGNLFLARPRVVFECQPMLERVFAMRKKPWQLSQLLGFTFILKFLLRRLAIREIEERVRDIFSIHGVAVITPYPEIGIDVDKPSDLELAAESLGRYHQA